jgi:hypothetical protein
VAQLTSSDDRGERELLLPHERLGIDGQPRFALGAQDVAGVQVLVDEDLLTLRAG